MPTTLQTRLLFAVGVLALAAMIAVGVSVRQGTRREFLRLQDVQRRSQSAQVPAVTEQVARALDRACCTAAMLSGIAQLLPRDLVLLIADAQTSELLYSSGRPLAGVTRLVTRNDGDVLVVEASRGDGGDVGHLALRLRSAGVSIALADGRMARAHVIPFPSEEREREAAAFLGSVDQWILATTALVGLLALAATWLIARGTLKPIAELQQATRDLAAGNLGRRVTPGGSAEVAELGAAFNAMAADLERQHLIRRNLVHDVAHELRTPLTAIRCRLETVLDGLAQHPARALSDLRDDVLHLGRLVDDLQDVALAESRELRLDPTDVELAPIVAAAVRASGLAGDARLRVDLPETLHARCDAGRVRQVLLNLLSNADRHTPPDGTITVVGQQDGGELRVHVHNTGSRLDQDQLDRVFDRFYRGDPARQRGTGGTGLGLAIARHLVEAQGGRVWVRSDDHGVTFGFSLPMARDPVRFARPAAAAS